MKNLLAGAMIVCMAMTSGAALAPPAPPVQDVTELLEIQDAAHDMAEAARRLGLPESHDVIQLAKSYWHSAQDEIESQPELVYLGRYNITGYDLCVKCCGKTDGITASGAVATVGRTAAAAGLPFGTRVWIDGIGERTIEDRGGMRGNVIDVLCNDHAECYAISRGPVDVWEVKE